MIMGNAMLRELKGRVAPLSESDGMTKIKPINQLESVRNREPDKGASLDTENRLCRQISN